MALELVLLTNLALILFLCLMLWCLSLWLQDVSIADVFWGLGFVAVTWLSYLNSSSAVSGGLAWFLTRQFVLILLVSLWGVRLAVYLGRRKWGQPEDHRYAAMRERQGDSFPMVSLVTVFGLQGVLMWLIALPLQLSVSEPPAWNFIAALGGLLWIVGMLFEVVGDQQMASFKADPTRRGQVMNQGLWRYTRHPNYFGEFLIWWGFYLLAARPDSWWWTLISPLLMSFLLIRVSGVRMLENSLRSRVEGYDEYLRTTSPFIPLPPKRKASTG